jgi:hypothetical protein
MAAGVGVTAFIDQLIDLFHQCRFRGLVRITQNFLSADYADYADSQILLLIISISIRFLLPASLP